MINPKWFGNGSVDVMKAIYKKSMTLETTFSTTTNINISIKASLTICIF